MGRPKLIKVDVTDARGLGGAKNKTVNVRTCIPDILAFRDTPGFAYLLLAANMTTPVAVLCRVLDAVGSHQSHPKTWMYKRRDLFRVPQIPVGTDEGVVAFISANRQTPAWKLRVQLRKRGIKCSVQTAHRIRLAISYLTSEE
jgi:hypothetical protein